MTMFVRSICSLENLKYTFPTFTSAVYWQLLCTVFLLASTLMYVFPFAQ